MNKTPFKQLIFLLAVALYACSSSKKLSTKIGGVDINYIKDVWARQDSCGASGIRDSVAMILVNKRVLFGLEEKEIEHMFGKPWRSAFSESGKEVTYILIGAHLRDNKERVIGCDDHFFFKILDIIYDSVQHKAYYVRTVME